MEAVREKKCGIRENISITLSTLSASDLENKTKAIENRLFEFANFLESNIILLYINNLNEVNTEQIIARSLQLKKIVILPVFGTKKNQVTLMKIDNVATNLKIGPMGLMVPDPAKCKVVPVKCIDIAIIPGLAMDEKGSRIGSGDGCYDKLIPQLPITTRKVGIAFEEQILKQLPTESHDKHVDIIITDKRIIYKI
ncbi:MAG: 5-formyltetrahydrofolate cyclo-ligase [Deltaproteobacteria bacterium]|nr:5-formyltetrahydrofolate cyclo-ligase [Deltaproteobacteria bacterium]